MFFVIYELSCKCSFMNYRRKSHILLLTYPHLLAYTEQINIELGWYFDGYKTPHPPPLQAWLFREIWIWNANPHLLIVFLIRKYVLHLCTFPAYFDKEFKCYLVFHIVTRHWGFFVICELCLQILIYESWSEIF